MELREKGKLQGRLGRKGNCLMNVKYMSVKEIVFVEVGGLVCFIRMRPSATHAHGLLIMRNGKVWGAL